MAALIKITNTKIFVFISHSVLVFKLLSRSLAEKNSINC